MDLDTLTIKIFGLYCKKDNQKLSPEDLQEFTKFYLRQLKELTEQQTRAEIKKELKENMLKLVDKI